MMDLFKSVRKYGHLFFYSMLGKDPSDYQAQWNSFWHSVEKTGTDGEVFWDNAPERASAQDLERFSGFMNPAIPLIDLGCGNGRQSRFLARHFKKVIGVDVSQSAIELAKKESEKIPNLEFRVFNAINPEEALALHAIYGDANIYMRGVMSVMQKKDRFPLSLSIATLLGNRGTMYNIELATHALDVFRKATTNGSSHLPKLLQNVVRHGVQTIGFDLNETAHYFPTDCWDILDEGSNVNMNTIPLSHGKELSLPSAYMILRRKTPSML